VKVQVTDAPGARTAPRTLSAHETGTSVLPTWSVSDRTTTDTGLVFVIVAVNTTSACGEGARSESVKRPSRSASFSLSTVTLSGHRWAAGIVIDCCRTGPVSA
jgi:hypothetical protein